MIFSLFSHNTPEGHTDTYEQQRLITEGRFNVGRGPLGISWRGSEASLPLSFYWKSELANRKSEMRPSHLHQGVHKGILVLFH